MNFITKSTMLVGLSIGYPTGSKQNKQKTAEVAEQENAEEESVSVYNHLFPKAVKKAMLQVVNEARNEFYKWTAPWSDQGFRLLPVKVFSEYNANMEIQQNKFWAMAREFRDVTYPPILANARARMGGMYDPSKFKSADEVFEEFRFKLSMFPTPSMDNFLLDLSKEETEYLKQEAERSIKESIDNAMGDFLEETIKLVDSIANCAEGKTNSVHASTMDKLIRQVKLAPAFNITNHPGVEKAMKAIEKRLLGLSSKDIRKDPALAQRVGSDARRITNAMRGMF